MRTIVELPDERIEGLKRLSDDMHLSRAALMRRAVKEYLARHRPQEADQAFGLWKDRPRDAIDATLAEVAATIRRSHGIRLPDAIIWASAQTKSALLISRNTKVFPADAPGMRVPYSL
jgi:hypothetical protein